MLQRRVDGSVDFFLNWSDYKIGFGDLSGEFWLGNEKIHRLTSNDKNKLRVDLDDFAGNTSYAEYDMFGVMSENDKYKLKLGSYKGYLVSHFHVLLTSYLKHCQDEFNTVSICRCFLILSLQVRVLRGNCILNRSGMVCV